MKFEDLHLMQQLYLAVLYTEGTMKPTIREGDAVYHDALNHVDIKLKDLKQVNSQGWVLFSDENDDAIIEDDNRVVINYEINTMSGLDEVQFFMSRIADESTHEFLDKFGLASSQLLRDDPVTEFTKLKSLVQPFAATDAGATLIVNTLDKLIAGAKKASQLPESFFKLIAGDVPAGILLKRMRITTQYLIDTSEKKHRRYTPIISVLDEYSIYLEYERKPSATMKVVMGATDTDFNVLLTSSTGYQEGGTFNLVSERDTSTTLNTTINLLTNIVEDSVHTDEYKPLLRRFLQYFNEGVKHVSSNVVLFSKGARK